MTKTRNPPSEVDYVCAPRTNNYSKARDIIIVCQGFHEVHSWLHRPTKAVNLAVPVEGAASEVAVVGHAARFLKGLTLKSPLPKDQPVRKLDTEINSFNVMEERKTESRLPWQLIRRL